jgi:hypothetical protein
MTSHPLADTFMRGRARSHRGCHFGASLNPVPGAGVGLESLVSDTGRLEALLEAVGEDVGSHRRDVQASLLVEAYAWALLLPLAGALLFDRRVPALGRAAVTLRDGLWPMELLVGGARFAALPDDSDADHPDAVVVAREDVLVQRLRAEIGAHLAPPLSTLAARSGRGRDALWRSVGDRASAALLFAGEAVGDVTRARALARKLLEGNGALVGRPDYRELATPAGPMMVHVRRGCCLWWRTRAANWCLTCPLATAAAGAPRTIRVP